MKRSIGSIVIAVFLVFMGVCATQAEDAGSECGVGYLEDLGDGEYMSDSGKIVEMEDIGGGSKMDTGGEIYQSYGTDDSDLSTRAGGLMQVDE